MSLRLQGVLAGGCLFILALPEPLRSHGAPRTLTSNLPETPVRHPFCACPAPRRDLGFRQAAVHVLESPEDFTDVGVRSLGRDDDGDLIVESDHIRVIYNRDRELMERVARVAETAWLGVTRKWFGDAPGEPDRKCRIYLYPSRKVYAQQTQNTNCLAHYQTRGEGYVRWRTISVPCNLPTLFRNVLPHEVTHAVMADRFSDRLPPWAQEGMACLSESPISLGGWRKVLEASWQQNGLFALEILLQTQEPRHLDCPEFYAQSISLVQFFVAQKGRRAFTGFLRDGIRVGYEQALKKHYGIRGFKDLNRRWLAYAFADPPPVPARPRAAVPAWDRRGDGDAGPLRGPIPCPSAPRACWVCREIPFLDRLLPRYSGMLNSPGAPPDRNGHPVGQPEPEGGHNGAGRPVSAARTGSRPRRRR